MASLLLSAARVAGVHHHRVGWTPSSMFGVLKSLVRGLASSATDKPFEKILIANRGEIACRVMRTARDMGIKTVAVYSEADAHSKHVKMADEAVLIGAPPSAESYLREDRIIQAMLDTGAEAVHPGYGFLSENATFARKIEELGLAWIGPPASAIDLMGDKIVSKQVAKEAGVKTIPGFDGEIETVDAAMEVAHEIGYPIMMKATAGGGGKGMRIAWNDDEVREGFVLSKNEALASFGDDRMLVEKFVHRPRHIEIQIMSDAHGNHIYLPERECTIQRRNQKVIEEAPSTFIDPALRKAMGEQAVALAAHVGYRSAGTVEMMVDADHNHYFLEMNTRLQVEHPVTEYITGIDLVEQMLRVAAGQPLSFKQDDITIKGWSMESRVYAEDPLRDFLPSVGALKAYSEPTGYGPSLKGSQVDVRDRLYQSSVSEDGSVRVDSGILEGSEILMYYDPLISKLVSYGTDRPAAIAAMTKALDSYVIRGVNHNIPFLRDVMTNPRFLDGNITTNFLTEEYPDGFQGHQLSSTERQHLAAVTAVLHKRMQTRRYQSSQHDDSASLLLRAATHPTETLAVAIDDAVQEVTLSDPPQELQCSKDVHAATVTITEPDADPAWVVVETAGPLNPVGVFDATITPAGADEGHTIHIQLTEGADREGYDYTVQYCGSMFPVSVMPPDIRELMTHLPEVEKVDLSKFLVSPMAGALLDVSVQEGDQVVVGQNLAMVEAMKMQNILTSDVDGVVKKIMVNVGDSVAADDIMIEFE